MDIRIVDLPKIAIIGKEGLCTEKLIKLMLTRHARMDI